MSLKIDRGCRVTLHYTLSLADGHVIESTRATEPATHVIGAGEWLAPLEERLLGLSAGDVRRFDIGAAEIGPADVANVQAMSRDEFPADMPLKPGMVIGFALPSGEEAPGTVLDVSEHEVIVDFSHPLAGRDLVWEVEILAVMPPPPK